MLGSIAPSGVFLDFDGWLARVGARNAIYNNNNNDNNNNIRSVLEMLSDPKSRSGINAGESESGGGVAE